MTDDIPAQNYRDIAIFIDIITYRQLHQKLPEKQKKTKN